MPNWNDLLYDITKLGSTYDIVRRDYLRKLHKLTGRNVIIYYSGWLQKPNLRGTELTDADKNGFMTAIHGLERKKGLDLVLHTPGGESAATESLVDYLRSMFDTDMRAIVPQLAMSAGTMIACACKVILMGKHSSLGPVDPQFRGMPAHGVVEEFKRAYQEILGTGAGIDQAKIAVWQPIIAKYNPTFVGECEKAIDWSKEMVQDWLKTGMLAGEADAEKRAGEIVEDLSDHALTKSHARHLSADKCEEIGLKIERLEKDQKLQEAVLSLHHAVIHTLSATGAFKVIENHNGTAFIQQAQTVIVQAPAQQQVS